MCVSLLRNRPWQVILFILFSCSWLKLPYYFCMLFKIRDKSFAILWNYLKIWQKYEQKWLTKLSSVLCLKFEWVWFILISFFISISHKLDACEIKMLQNSKLPNTISITVASYTFSFVSWIALLCKHRCLLSNMCPHASHHLYQQTKYKNCKVFF